ncbi:hypothetical protein QWY93_16070 [Echinicola jeungdonensis]|uniref:Uncharacterized protein n=1 Tax=Echinicola jeungdonensis TaxID=709343 RepID=A0ABV5J6U5_9BACT|nr:hypothetical protein [Echinicola jeungdonensis]MDN3670838.1 hypothetical protein [Echinicola jeungdonensis]
MENRTPYIYIKKKWRWSLFVILIISIPIFIIPAISHLIWKVKPSFSHQFTILDKTVPDEERLEHRAIFWTLNHLKINKPNGLPYNFKEDYLGFFPKENAPHTIRDLSGYSAKQIDSLAINTDAFYLVDSYGVYDADFSDQKTGKISKKIYGGLTENDLELLDQLIKKKKLVIAEFNSMGAPTQEDLRLSFEKKMKIRWTGWISRYFDELDTLVNEELPNWLIKNYKNQHGNIWHFKGSGQVFVHESGQVEILKFGEDLTIEVPHVTSPYNSQTEIPLPKSVNFPYWFEIIRISRDYEVISYIDLSPNKSGLKKLQEMGLPQYFPATIHRKNGEGDIYYFTGDFADNPIGMKTSSFAGFPWLKKMTTHRFDYSNRTSFYWNYYFPLLNHITKKHLRK